MLRASIEQTGAEYGLGGVIGEGDGGIPDGSLLIEFAEAVLGTDARRLNRARERLLETLGPAALVDAAGVAATFNGIDRVADATGTPIDEAAAGEHRRNARAAWHRPLPVGGFVLAAPLLSPGRGHEPTRGGEMTDLSYEAASAPVRQDIVAEHRNTWQRIARPGTWFDGPTRVAIAAESRNAPNCALCAERKAALSPFAVEGTHDSLGELPETMVEMIHRIVTDPGRLRRQWYDEILAGGVGRDRICRSRRRGLLDGVD